MPEVMTQTMLRLLQLSVEIRRSIVPYNPNTESALAIFYHVVTTSRAWLSIELKQTMLHCWSMVSYSTKSDHAQAVAIVTIVGA